jgi:acetylornithine/succinyldiaminopimelate/putrescine aminotransferase
MEELASGLLEHVRRVGHVLRSQLEELARRFPERIRQVRGRGLMLGIELDGAAEYLRDALLGEGVVVGISGQRVLRILPPLIVSAEEVEFFCAALERVLQRMR